MSYRSIWEKQNGKISEGYEIHHIDGNHFNNSLSNLKCVSIQEHYSIHMQQGDWMACSAIMMRMNITSEGRKRIHALAMKERDQTGSKNPMYGRSAIREHNFKWYNDGIRDKMFTEGTQPEGWSNGRINMPKRDVSGSKNPRAKSVEINGKFYQCLKDALVDYSHIPYSSLKTAAKRGNSKLYNLRIKYV